MVRAASRTLTRRAREHDRARRTCSSRGQGSAVLHPLLAGRLPAVRGRTGRGMTGGRGTWDRWSGGGLLIVAVAGATLSCTSLAGLARACGYGPHLAWLLPVSI